MDKKPRSQVIAEFWERMDETIGIVPVNVKNVVNVLELAATSWLGDFTDDDVSALEALVCWKGGELWTQGGKDAYYEGGVLEMGEDFRSFEFSNVEKKWLVAVAGAVKRYGHDYFTVVCINQNYEFSHW
ncbi:uncharacterized protein LOC115256564 [Aedes albopictus]|uniref:Uncharacterized protein n=1 Tax=Aedes albopictus TaxID=7160 RepID=A0ABM1Y8P6_AEDAL|nr:uncharacterized protein LOC115256564 [Aedes albopictus]